MAMKKKKLYLSILFSLNLTNLFIRSDSLFTTQLHSDSWQSNCSSALKDLKYPSTKCQFLKSQTICETEGFINYLRLFYCSCGESPFLGYTILLLFLLVLFYLLADTASDYFCSALENLSRILKLSPTVAGVTLLSLGNGAPDVFASLVSFMGSGTSGVGLNSSLGGALFVSTVVIGIVSICISSRKVTVDKTSFIRDICFLIIALCSLLLILVLGEISIWGAMGFLSLYFIYIFAVYVGHVCKERKQKEVSSLSASPLLQVVGSSYSCRSEEYNESRRALLGSYEEDEEEQGPILLERRASDLGESCHFKFEPALSEFCSKLLYVLRLPLSLPRRLTIPVVCEEKWSKPFGVASVTFAPMFLSVLWNFKEGNLSFDKGWMIYMIGGLTGVVLGILAFFTTEKNNPPTRCLFPWLLGSFLMSVAWTYLVAQEVVSLLVDSGIIIGIKPSILGLTVLAWGNSIGDLIADLALALKGGKNGAQIAMSGCYAGPLFNILVGLGLSLVFASWSQYPSVFTIPSDSSLFVTMGFMVAGLLWAVLILLNKDMKLDKVLGGGLLTIYLCFLSLRLIQLLAFQQS